MPTTNLNLGTTANDGTGDTLRAGGQIINDNFAVVQGDLATHINDNTNPHSVTKAQVGLSNVNNTSDLDKPLSTSAIAKNTAQDNAIAINTAKNSYPSADANKVANLPVDQNSVNTTLQSNIDDKQDELVSGTNIKTVNSQSLLGSGNIEITGGGAVDSVNTQTGDVVLDADDISDATTTNKFVQQEVVTTLGSDDTTIPTSKAVADAITGSGGGDMLSTNNLSDVASVPDARDNLGLGNLATLDTVDTAQIENDAVTFPKMQNIPTNRVLGRASSGNGEIEDLTLPNFRSLIDVYTKGETNNLLDDKLDNEGYASIADLITGENIATTDSANTFSEINTFLTEQRISSSGNTVSGLLKIQDGGIGRRIEILSPNSSKAYGEINLAGTNADLQIGTRDYKTAINILGSNGNVGIGTTSPADELHILNSSGTAKLRIETGLGTGNYTSSAHVFKTPTRTSELGLRGSTALDAPNSMFVFHNGAMRQVWDSNGNVGIGTTIPGAKLDIEATSGDLLELNGTGSNNTILRFRDDGTEFGAIYGLNGFGELNVRSNGDLNFLAGGAIDRMTISSNGNVGIGTTIPGEKLHIEGDILLGVADIYKGKDTSGTTRNLMRVGTNDFFVAGDKLKINFSTGNAIFTNGLSVTNSLGIGTTSPGEKLHINGGMRIGTTANAVAGNIRWNGTKFQGYDGTAWRNFH